MNAKTDIIPGRYLLYLDLLGFTSLVATKRKEDIFALFTETLDTFTRWEGLNKQFRTICFSDTFLLYQEPEGYADWAFLDAYALGAMILSALLAKKIPARGAISFGDFEVRNEGRHQIYYGHALIEAYNAEKKENWIGITILESAWSIYEKHNPGTIAIFENEGSWIRRDDGVLLLNPFIRLHGWHDMDSIGEVGKPYMQWDMPEFPNAIRGFQFLREEADRHASLGDFSGKVAIKYHATIAFLKQILGDDIYEWGMRLSQHEQDR